MDESVVLKVLGETENTKTIIRLAVKEDLPRLHEIYEYSRQVMLDYGNLKEWSRVFPEDEAIESFIEDGKCYVISFWEYKEEPIPEDVGKKSRKKKGEPEGPTIIIEETVHAAFVFDTEVNEHYNNIYQGQWIDEDTYATLKYLASDGEFSGIFAAVMGFCMPLARSIKVDTFDENTVMTKLLLGAGFERCGTVIGDHGVPTVGYQLICPVARETDDAEDTDETAYDSADEAVYEPVNDAPVADDAVDAPVTDETVVVE